VAKKHHNLHEDEIKWHLDNRIKYRRKKIYKKGERLLMGKQFMAFVPMAVAEA